jgi:16S rRNA G527 N7-methylase RsmG
VESKNRKAAFLREAIRQLGLKDTAVEASRVEELLSRPHMHEGADVVTVRAVRLDKKFLAEIQAFLKPHGLLFLFRNGDPAGDTQLSSDLLHHEANHALLPHLQSRLVILRNVPRGT